MWLFSFYFPVSSPADIIKNSAVAIFESCMNIEINIFTVLENDLKNVSERKLPI
jgi:hypothetical protein